MFLQTKAWMFIGSKLHFGRKGQLCIHNTYQDSLVRKSLTALSSSGLLALSYLTSSRLTLVVFKVCAFQSLAETSLSLQLNTKLYEPKFLKNIFVLQ